MYQTIYKSRSDVEKQKERKIRVRTGFEPARKQKKKEHRAKTIGYID